MNEVLRVLDFASDDQANRTVATVMQVPPSEPTQAKTSDTGSRRSNISGIVVFGLLTAALAVATIAVGVDEKPNRLAAALLQVLTVLFGVVTSYFYSKVSGEDAARAVIRPHARASIRRSVTLYRALERQVLALERHYSELENTSDETEDGRKVVDLDSVKWSIAGLQLLVTEQLATAADSLEDWRDIVPDEVQRIYAQSEEKNG